MRSLSLLTCTVLTGAAAGLCLNAAQAYAAQADDQAGVAVIPSVGQDDATNFGVDPAMLKGNEQPVDLEADTLTHDEQAQIVTAAGNVELVQGGKILKADRVSYNLQNDRVHAEGNVVISQEDGTTYFADKVELTKDMKDGFVRGLQILLADGARFTAREGERTNGTTLILKQASYTPCEPCKEDPSRPPVWQLRAAKVTHYEDEKRIAYRDAWFELGGVPVMYTPYFSHPDGTEKQKSGLLTPKMGFDSQLGVSYQQEYYYAIAPDKDATIGTIVSTDVNPVALGEYRQRFDNGQIQFNGSTTYSSYTDSIGTISRETGDELRGHMFANGLWDMSDTWRSGFKAQAVSDDQYLRQYDISSEDVLENELYAERLSGRNYTVGRMLAFHDVRVSDRAVDQPAVLPEVISSYYGDPNGLLGGRWNAQLSALGLYRDGNGQDVGRGSVELGWQRRYITGFGLVNKVDALLRGDAYNIEDQNMATLSSGADSNNSQTRGFAQANWQISYPVAKRFEAAQWVVEPLFSLTAGTNVHDNEDIPNEDSQDFSVDALNLFEPNRSPGYDLIEDRTRMTYGLRNALYADNGYRGEIFLGQSKRFESQDNPFYEGSGLADDYSDYVGQITAALDDYLTVDYRFQLQNDDFSSKRHELDAITNIGRLQLGARYLYAAATPGAGLDETREQIRPAAKFRIYDDWYINGAVWYDFGENEGLRQASYGVSYIGQCMTLALVTERTLTEDSTGDSGTEIMLRIGFKNLGEFESSGIRVGGNDNSSSNSNDENVNYLQ